MRSIVYYKVVLILTRAVIASEIVKTKNGVLKGILGESKNGNIIREFYGIPYAEPPIGKDRYQPPRAAQPWNNTRDATKPANMCIQPEHFYDINSPTKGNEDCLYLNVFTPKVNSTLKLATCVYLHGGAFAVGSGSEYSPKYFLNYPIILVTVNYRLGSLGFLSMNNDIISGNFGLKDQSLALKWVKENIEFFGGDPDNVCLMGQSAGAAAVHFHMFSPLSKGLFQKAIMQSGSAFSPFAYYDEQYTKAQSTTFAITTGCYHNDPQQILRCLQNLPAEYISQTENRLYVWQTDPIMQFKASIESNVTQQPFLTVDPIKSSYPTTNIPYIIGMNSGDGIFKVLPYLENGASLARIIDSNRPRLLPLIIQYLYTTEPEFLGESTDKIVGYYFGNKRIGPESGLKFVEMVTDSLFTYPLWQTISSSSGPRYVYLFDHNVQYATQSRLSQYSKNLGVSHSDEMAFLFYQQEAEKQFTAADQVISKSMLDMWTNFVINSDPNDKLKEKVWKPVETSEIEYLHITSDGVATKNGFLKERYRFWDSLPLGRKHA